MQPIVPTSRLSSYHNAAMLRLIFRSLVFIVFIGMNLLYQLFWKKSAKTDYFESKGISNLPTEATDKMEFAPRQEKTHLCGCGYDLQAFPDRWLPAARDTTPRCPKCAREIFLDEVDLSRPANVPLEKFAVAPIATSVLPPVDENIPAEKLDDLAPMIGIPA